MSWPTPQEYNEAIQNPRVNCGDAELQSAKVQVNSLGLPRVTSGAFASVYKLQCPGRAVAVRCFLHPISDQAERYSHLSSYIMNDELDYTVGFEFIERGIRIRGNWYPILKMEWVEGDTLDAYIKKHLTHKGKVEGLLSKFLTMSSALSAAGIAHGDLQHGNIIIVNDQLRLVDYDGMYIPALSGWRANELGHRNYQHPARSAEDFGAFLDNFSFWSVYTSLSCLAKSPKLLVELSGCDECLLFRQHDYKYPLRSPTFSLLETYPSEEVVSSARLFRSLLDKPLSDIPALTKELQVPTNLPELLPPMSLTKGFSSNLPDWLYATEYVSNLSHEHLKQQEPPPDEEWPKLIDYMRALSSPASCFDDAELAATRVISKKGTICAKQGDESIVFFLQGEKIYAIKCFLRPDKSRALRYDLLKKAHLNLLKLSKYFVNYSYHDLGIKVGTRWFPIVKMDNADGVTLDELLENSRTSRTALNIFRNSFELMVRDFEKAHIAHGNLDPRNIIVNGDRIKLVDYETMFTPSSAGFGCYSLPNPHVRHPSHRTNYFSAKMDRFSQWVIDLTVEALLTQPDLWNIYAQEGRLIFSQSDFQNPNSSALFNMLSSHYKGSLRARALQLKSLLSIPPDHIPPLSESVAVPASTKRSSFSLFRRTPPSPTGVPSRLKEGEVYAIVIFISLALIGFGYIQGYSVLLAATLIGLAHLIDQKKP